MISWCKAKGFNTLITPTFNIGLWANGWPNMTAFQASDKNHIDYTKFNVAMWDLWDRMIMAAAQKNIYIGPFQGPHGKYGGQRSGKYPPSEMSIFPALTDKYNSDINKVLIRYLIARQGAFWNLAYWSLGNTEVYNKVSNGSEFSDYMEYFAGLTPWKRMITAQDCEQWHDINRRWISAANIPQSRKLNLVQTAVASREYPYWGTSHTENTTWQKTRINNEFALDSYGDFPVIATEALWEGQGRAKKPLSIIMGFLTAGAHVVFADWNYDDGIDGGRWGSIGRSWTPVKPLSESLYLLTQLGKDTVGDEQLRYVSNVINMLEYWEMSPHNELAGPQGDVFCLAEPSRQYLLYLPDGGNISVHLAGTAAYNAYWYNPNNGNSSASFAVSGGTRSVSAPNSNEWILVVKAASLAPAPQKRPAIAPPESPASARPALKPF